MNAYPTTKQQPNGGQQPKQRPARKPPVHPAPSITDLAALLLSGYTFTGASGDDVLSFWCQKPVADFDDDAQEEVLGYWLTIGDGVDGIECQCKSFLFCRTDEQGRRTCKHCRALAVYLKLASDTFGALLDIDGRLDTVATIATQGGVR